ncbi:MAG: hypothetical protein QOF33_2393 [Thermomicrobiales bacterium]|nr:hypothetical protein [Thermomicrobiales bacterium]
MTGRLGHGREGPRRYGTGAAHDVNRARSFSPEQLRRLRGPSRRMDQDHDGIFAAGFEVKIGGHSRSTELTLYITTGLVEHPRVVPLAAPVYGSQRGTQPTPLDHADDRVSVFCHDPDLSVGGCGF